MKQIYFVTDVESDGPIPGDYSIVSIGTVVVDLETLPQVLPQNLSSILPTFYCEMAPISETWVSEALAISGVTREQHKAMEPAGVAIQRYLSFVNSFTRDGEHRPIFISDNNGYDWMFVCWYLWKFGKCNPFGYSSGNLNWLYKGITKNFYKSIKHLRRTKHTHNPVDDAMGNAEAFIEIVRENNIRL